MLGYEIQKTKIPWKEIRKLNGHIHFICIIDLILSFSFLLSSFDFLVSYLFHFLNLFSKNILMFFHFYFY